MSATVQKIRAKMLAGLVIPAHPLALTAERKLDERRQRALSRYYCDAGAGGMAVGVHTTQFAIREPRHGLFEPVLRLAMEEMHCFEKRTSKALAKIGGICGDTAEASREASLLIDIGYDAGLLSLAALRDATECELLEHSRAIAAIIPLVGFYLQPAVGGRLLSHRFWTEFAAIENVVAIKIAPFNRYQTLDVLRAVAESGRAGEIALYTGNDDNIVTDLITDFRFGNTTLRFAGGLLGHWAVWTKRAVELLERIQSSRAHGEPLNDLLARATEVTDSNAALFDPPNQFHGCIPGLHEVLRRQGLLEGRWCLDPGEDLSPGQLGEIDRVCRSYPYLTDDDFVRQNVDRWLS